VINELTPSAAPIDVVDFSLSFVFATLQRSNKRLCLVHRLTIRNPEYRVERSVAANGLRQLLFDKL
jgi:hypothetical protein